MALGADLGWREIGGRDIWLCSRPWGYAEEIQGYFGEDAMIEKEEDEMSVKHNSIQIWREGVKFGVWLYAIWRNGKQLVGIHEIPLEAVLKVIDSGDLDDHFQGAPMAIITRLNRAIELIDEWQEGQERTSGGELPEALACALQEIVNLRDDIL